MGKSYHKQKRNSLHFGMKDTVYFWDYLKDREKQTYSINQQAEKTLCKETVEVKKHAGRRGELGGISTACKEEEELEIKVETEIGALC